MKKNFFSLRKNKININSENLKKINKSLNVIKNENPYLMRKRIKINKNNSVKKEEFKDVSNVIKSGNEISRNFKKKSFKTINNVNKDREEEFLKLYYEGRLLWGKLKSHPWWPCMIYKDPDNIFYRNSHVHVVYFGPIVERGWLHINFIMPFEGKEKYDESLLKIKGSNNKKVLKDYYIPPSRFNNWKKALEEAEIAMLLKLSKRIREHGILYENMIGKSFDSDSSSNSSDYVSIKLVLDMPSSSSDNNIDETSIVEFTHDNNARCEMNGAGLPTSFKVVDEIVRAGLNDVNVVDETTIGNIIATVETNDERKSLTMEFNLLNSPSFTPLKRILICLLCLKDCNKSNNMIISCSGNCGQTFHITCMETLLNFLINDEIKKPYIDYKRCVDCNKERRRCFMCHKLINENKPNEIMKCFFRDCGRYFHSSCINEGIYQNFVRNNREGSINCPSHTCHSCHCENPATVRHAYTHVRCIMCPASYHRGDWCVPAGSKQINELYIICPQHLKHSNSFDAWVAPFMDCVKDNLVTLDKYNFIKSLFTDFQDLWIVKKQEPLDYIKTNNVTFCFLCSTGGHLICCEKCPASFHQTCLKITELPDYFVCEECQLGKYPRYGEVIWAKISTCRWWPGQVIHDRNAPLNLINLYHEDGQFLVRFMGTNDYYWCTKMHVFSFDEGDDELPVSEVSSDDSTIDDSTINDSTISEFKGRKEIDDSYAISLKLAGKVFRRRFKKWKDIIDNNDRPNHYRKIKNNIPIGKVRIQKLSCASESHRCECQPSVGNNDRDPCGPSSDCINRQVQYECHPLTCRNKNKCKNQRFMLREYPKLKIFHTKDRGWALKTIERIKKGSFVNEYVGELIDNEEANRRLNVAHENDITDFYMMILDSQRIIDAGPAANESRFINHSCSPNVFTQQWFVNGDHRIGIFALCDIEANEELTFNYHFVSFGEMKIPCKCGAENCSGFLGLAPKPPSSTDLQSFVKEPKPKKISKKCSKDEINYGEKENIFKRNSVDNQLLDKKINDLIFKEDADDFCFICREKNCNMFCSYNTCVKSYHYECLGLKETIRGKQWFCPWHFCDECGKRSEILCSFCITSYCNAHLCDRIVISEDDIMKCLNTCRVLEQRYIAAEFSHSPSI